MHREAAGTSLGCTGKTRSVPAQFPPTYVLACHRPLLTAPHATTARASPIATREPGLHFLKTRNQSLSLVEGRRLHRPGECAAPADSMPMPNVGCCWRNARTNVGITSRSRSPVRGLACVARQRTLGTMVSKMTTAHTHLVPDPLLLLPRVHAVDYDVVPESALRRAQPRRGRRPRTPGSHGCAVVCPATFPDNAGRYHHPQASRQASG